MKFIEEMYELKANFEKLKADMKKTDLVKRVQVLEKIHKTKKKK